MPRFGSLPENRFVGRLRVRCRGDVPALVLGLLLGLAVCFPWANGKPLYLLDWVVGPHVPIISPPALALYGGVTANIPGLVVEAVLHHVVGASATWLPIFAVFPVAAFAASRLTGGNLLARLSAAALYSVNPFVFQRLYAGHVLLLLGYALLPLAIRSAVASVRLRGIGRMRPVLWWVVLTALSPHFAWIYGVVILLVTGVANGVSLMRRFLGFVFQCVVFLALSLYLLLPQIGSTPPFLARYSPALTTFRTSGDPHLGLFANLAGLYGFWRVVPGPQLPKNVISGWFFFLVALWVTIGAGIISGIQERREGTSDSGLSRRKFSIALILVGVTGYLLALGTQGPTGPLFSFAFNHIPFFSVMREPQKFLMLLAISYSVFFGWGVERILASRRNPKRLGSLVVGSILLIGLPFAYTPNLFGGLGGQLSTSNIPNSWAQADHVMGSGDGKVLFLPWHLYLGFDFTDSRTIANPAPSSFRRDVISGDNLEVSQFQSISTSQRSDYLEKVFSQSSKARAFGALIAPLGVKFVVLAKTADWSSYTWLFRQNDLITVLQTRDLIVWRNAAYEGVGQALQQLIRLPSASMKVEALIGLTNNGRKVFGAVASGGVPHQTASQTPGRSSALIRQRSPVEYQVKQGRFEWVAIDAPFQSGWQLDGHDASPSAEGTLLFYDDGRGGMVRFQPWKWAEVGYYSSGSFVAILIVLLLQVRDGRRGWRRLQRGTPRFS